MADEAKPAAKKSTNWGVFFLKVFLILLLIYLILVPGVNILYNWGDTGGFHLRAKDFSPLTTWKNIQLSIKSVGNEIDSVSEDDAETIPEEDTIKEGTEDESAAPTTDESETSPIEETTSDSLTSAKDYKKCDKDEDCKDENKFYCENKQCKSYCGEAASCSKGEKCDDDTNRCVSTSWISGNWWWILVGIVIILGGIFGLKKWRTGRSGGGTPSSPPSGAPAASSAVSGTP